MMDQVDAFLLNAIEASACACNGAFRSWSRCVENHLKTLLYE